MNIKNTYKKKNRKRKRTQEQSDRIKNPNNPSVDQNHRKCFQCQDSSLLTYAHTF